MSKLSESQQVLNRTRTMLEPGLQQQPLIGRLLGVMIPLLVGGILSRERHSQEKERDTFGRRRGTQSGEREGQSREKEKDTVGRKILTKSGE